MRAISWAWCVPACTSVLKIPSLDCGSPLEPSEWFRLPKARLESEPGGGDKSMGPEMVEMLIAERKAARLAKNYKRSDEIRKQISDAGIILEDKPDGTTIWRYS